MLAQLRRWWQTAGETPTAAPSATDPLPSGPLPPRAIVVERSRAIAAGTAAARRLQKDRDMVDQMNVWVVETLPEILDQVLGNSTYHYTLIDAHRGGRHEWMNHLDLLEPFAKAMWEQGFAFSSPDPQSEYHRMSVSLRTPELRASWASWRDTYFDRKARTRT